MKLKRLFRDIPHCHIKGARDDVVTGLTANSKLVAPGNLFIAKRGEVYDGTQYISEAIEGGACAVLTDLFDPSLKQVIQVIHPAVSEIEAQLATIYYNRPADHLLTIGITGTNGKTTTAYIIKHLLDQLHGPCGLIGTIEYMTGHHRYQATHTTPDVLTNHRMLCEMVTAGCRSVVMEVTSHALNQGRVQEIDYDVAVFSNLTRDHLDYHQTMEQYGQAKRRLFQQLGSFTRKKSPLKCAVVNLDDPWTPHLFDGCSASFLTYSLEQAADLTASDMRLEGGGTRVTVNYRGEKVTTQWPLVGRFNAYNCLSAVGVLLTQGFALQDILDSLTCVKPVPGRLELVPNKLGIHIYVDFSHTDDALANALKTLRELKPGRLIAVFGCGGDRDATKRPKMGEVSEQYADFTIVTSDNPRSEDPLSICHAIVKGFKNAANYRIELDRREAIRRALLIATAGDIVLIAGKGHEKHQIFAYQTIEFDDVQVATEISEELLC